MDELENRAVSNKVPVIYNIQRYSIQDGPGSRTTIFVKGCPLRCPWCHNPETQKKEVEVLFDKEKCTLCGACVKVCPTGAASIKDNEIVQDYSKCTGCGKCADVCMAEARSLCGRVLTMDEIVREARRDEMFFVASDGGVTISGGDPMYFPEFTIELARRLHDELIHVVVDTAAFCQWKYLDEVSNSTDLFLIDIKSMDITKYIEVIKASLPVVKTNIENLLNKGASVRVRIPVIPGFNDSENDQDAFTEYLSKLRGAGLEGVDILPFHSYAAKKYKISGRWDNYVYKEAESLQPENVKGFVSKLKQAGFSGKDSSLTIGGITR